MFQYDGSLTYNGFPESKLSTLSSDSRVKYYCQVTDKHFDLVLLQAKLEHLLDATKQVLKLLLSPPRA